MGKNKKMILLGNSEIAKQLFLSYSEEHSSTTTMAVPLKKPAVPSSPARRLLNTGAAPLRTVRLKGINGKPIVPALRTQSPVVPAQEGESAPASPDPIQIPPEVEAPASEQAPVVQSADLAEEEARRAAEEEARRAAEEEARRAAEEEARRAAEEEARHAAEEEKSSTKGAAESSPEPASAPSTRSVPRVQHAAKRPLSGLTVAMPKFKKPAAPAASTVAVSPTAADTSPVPPKADASPDSKSSDDHGATESPESADKETPRRDYTHVSAEKQAKLLQKVDTEYVETLRSTAEEKPPIWRGKLFWAACIALVVVIGVCGALVINHNAKLAAKRAENEKIMAILTRAREINKLGIETLADAKAQKLDVRCSKQEARFLMDVVVNPEMKDSNGKPLFGGHPEGVAQLACMLLSIAAEADDDVSKIVFNRLAKDASKIEPSLYRWLVQRLAVADIKGVNDKLHHLAEAVAKKSVKKFKKRDEILACIWESMGLRVTEKDIPVITELLRKPKLGKNLVNTLAHCLDNIVEQLDTIDQKKELGDKIYDALPENRRANLILTLAKSCSPKALTYYKQLAANPDNWRSIADYFSCYGQDDIITYMQEELLPLAGDDERKKKTVQNMISTAVRQNRDRSPEEAQRLVKLVFDKVDEDTTAWSDVMAQTNPDAATFIGKDAPNYPALMEQRKSLEKCRDQKLQLIKTLSGMYDWPWVVQYLERFSKENDATLAAEAKRALEATRNNRAENDRARAHYKQRTK